MGIVGLGEIHGVHAAALSKVGELSPIAVHDRDDSKSSLLPGVRTLSTLDELFAHDLDVVLISVGTPQHYDVARKVLSRGISVILEKPATTNRSDLEELYWLSDQVGACLYVAFHDAFGKEVGFAWENELWRQGLRGFESRYCDPYSDRPDFPEIVDRLSGSWLDSGSNALSVLCTSGFDFHVESARFEVREPYGADTCAQVTLRSADGKVAGSVVTTWDSSEKVKCTILHYEDHEIVLDHSGRQVVRSGDGSASEEVLFRSGSSLERMVEQYIEVFRNFRDDYAHGCIANRSFSLAVHDLLFAALECSGHGQE